ncbi:glycosyltransferase [Vibrio parahaemolyticus]
MQEYREKKRCENNHVSISFVGRLSEEKGILEFVSSICSILIDSPVNVNFNIVGDGLHLNAIKDAIKENVNKNIEFTMFGKVPKSQVDTILARSEFVLLPSLCYENAPLSLVEGAMHGCKIITMNYGGMKEIAEMQPYSFLLNSFSESELQRLLRYIDNNRNNETDNSKLIHSYSESQYVDTINDIFQRFRCE